ASFSTIKDRAANGTGISGSAGKNGANKDRRGQITNRVTIDARPAVVDERTRTGDRELEAMIGKNHRGALITIVERKTRFTLIGRLPRRGAALLKNELVAMLSPYRGKVFTITADNGKENSEHQEIAKLLGADFFFAHP
ncbi:MAG: IS30 family transposase, partial [candidate division KSB1 bacterium]|nr:IS30 family transposase [candidate division KSB1 bacterium]